MRLSDLQYLMHQLGPATPEIITILQEDIDSWMIEFDEGVSMQMAWDDRSSHVLMKCALGQPEHSAREAVYATLLGANRLLTGVAEVKLALGDSDDDVLLIGQYDLGEPTLDDLRQRLSEFLVYAGKFSQMIARTLAGNAQETCRPEPGMTHIQI